MILSTVVNFIKANKKKVITGVVLAGAGLTALLVGANAKAEDEVVEETVEEVNYEVTDSPDEQQAE